MFLQNKNLNCFEQSLFNFYANRAGCGTGSVVAQLACLRKASVSALARAQDAASTPALYVNLLLECNALRLTHFESTASGYNVFRPVIDGKIITDFPTRSILEGKFAKVPLIVG